MVKYSGSFEKKKNVFITEEKRKRGLNCSRHDALLLTYIRAVAPEFDLIFLRKEIKREWLARAVTNAFEKLLKHSPLLVN